MSQSVINQNQINSNKYSNAINSFNQFHDAKWNELTTLISQASQLGIDVTSAATSTINASVNPIDNKSVQNVINRIDTDYQNQINNVSNIINLQKQRLNNSSNIIYSTQVIQKLKSGTEANAQLTVSNATNGALVQNSIIKKANDQTYVEGQKGAVVWLYSDETTGFRGDDNFPPLNKKLDVQSADFDITYNNLQNWSYNDRKISKIIYHVHAYQNKLSGHPNSMGTLDKGGWHLARIQIGSDPTNGLILLGVGADININFYYEDGSRVQFKPGTAYFSVGSLNNYQNQLYGLMRDGKTRNNIEGFSIEHTKVLSGGTAVGLWGSSVTPHGNDLYSTNPNTIKFGDSDRVKSRIDNGHGFVYRNYNAPDATGLNWDIPGNPNQYYGAGLIRLNGDELKLQVGERFDNIPSNATARNGQWWNMSTIIPKTPNLSITYHDIKVDVMPLTKIDPPVKQYASLSYHSNTLI